MATKKKAAPGRRNRIPVTLRPAGKPDRRQSTGRAAGGNTIIVGVGASAGGLEAFSQLLRALPANAGLAIVFVQHLAPKHDSALVPLLSAQTSLPVIQVTEGLRVLPNHVYVIPPNVQMLMSDDELHLGPRPQDRSQYTPVDSFFCSLAEAAGSRAVGVILSGTGSDGALGVRAIKSAGGLVFAQTPESAKYDGMPQSAVGTGCVDLSLAADAIGLRLAELATTEVQSKGLDDQTAVTDKHLQQVYELLRPATGVDFRHYKPATIRRRLVRRMALHRLDTEKYVTLLKSSIAEARALYQDLLIHVTRFFREPDSFVALVTQVFPALMESRSADNPIRVWVSGCATGEEAYSLAIALVEYLQRDHADTRIQIFATDVSESALDQARTGLYPSSIEADVPPERLRRFFVKQDGGYRVTKMIRDLCVFARQDLTKDAPFSRLDLILCRNVLIYMDAVLQKKLLSVFHYALKPEGFLVLGQAETVGGQATLFSVVDKKHRIHRKKPGVPSTAISFPMDYSGVTLPRKTKSQIERQGTENIIQSEVSRLILDRYAPAGVVVDTDLKIVQFRGQTGAFLEPAPGEASLGLLKMAREGLLYGLRTALHTARKTGRNARKTGLQVKAGNGWRAVTLEVIPVTAAGRQHYLVLFEDGIRAAKDGAEPKPATPRRGQRSGRRERPGQIDVLQRELVASREYLQSIIQELEAANEELQSANEEILSSNEELQSTNEELDTAKEELQSTNEELNTVNEELHGRNEELSRVNSDLVNLVASVQIAIVIVALDLRIRRFTPMAEKVLNLLPADLDRSIGHINPNIDCPDLEALIAECIDTVSPLEREVQDRQGRWYSLRVRPYKNIDNKIDGAVIALFDIDAPKRFEESVRSAIKFADGLLESVDHPMAVLTGELRVNSANAAFGRCFGTTAEKMRGRPLTETVAGLGDLTDLRGLSEKPNGSVERLTLAYLPAGAAPSLIPVSVRVFNPDVGTPKYLFVSIGADTGEQAS